MQSAIFLVKYFALVMNVNNKIFMYLLAGTENCAHLFQVFFLRFLINISKKQSALSYGGYIRYGFYNFRFGCGYRKNGGYKTHYQ